MGNLKDIVSIVLLLIILAIIFKLMQMMKLQTEMTTGMALKMGVIRKKTPKEIQEERRHREVMERETEEGEYEEENEESDENKEESDENEEEDNEENKQEETSGVRDLDPAKKFIRVTKPDKEVETPKKSKSHSVKMKSYEKMALLIEDKPMTSGEMIEKYETQFGNSDTKVFWKELSYALKKEVIKKHEVTPKRYIYGTEKMFDGDTLKSEFLPVTTSTSETTIE